MDAIAELVFSLIETFELDFAFATLLIYDHILCIGEEVEHFWTGPRSLSKLLYLVIRYMGFGFAIFLLATLKLTLERPHEAEMLAIKLYVFVVPITILCQSVITLRVWYLFSRNLSVRIFAVATWFASTIATIVLFAVQWNTIRFDILHPLVPSSPTAATLYVPSFVIHTVLFALKVYRFFTSSVRVQSGSILWGLLKEGMLMYACASVSLLFGVVALTMVETSQLAVRAPAAAASPVLTLIIISVCRAMLSLRSLAATAHVDPEWLLNHAELSRVHWRPGTVDGEIIVEIGEPSIPLDTKYVYP